MAEDDIVQRIIITADDQATPVLNRAFQQATQSISALGNTSLEATDKARALAQQYGATASELAVVESRIRAIQRGVRDSSGSFTQLATNFDKSAASARQTAATAENAAAAVVKTGKAAAEAGAGFEISRRELSAFGRALSQLNLGPIGSEIVQMGRIGLVFGAPAAAVLALGAAISGTVVALFKFAEGAAETSKELTELQRVSGQSFENLSSLQTVFAEGGTSAKQFASEYGKLSEQIAEAGQQGLIRRSSKEYVEFANNISTIRNRFENLASGAQQTFSPLTTMATKAQAVKEALANLGRFTSPEEQLLRLAEIFKNLSSDVERAQLGKALGLTPEFIQTLSLGADKLRAMQQEIANLGLGKSKLDQLNLNNLTESMNRASALFDALKSKMGALAAPAFTSFFQGISDQLGVLSPKLQDIARQFGQLDFSELGRQLVRAGASVIGFVTDLLAAASGSAEAKEKLKKSIKAIGDEAKPVAVEAGKDIAQSLMDALFAKMVEIIKAGPPADLFGGMTKSISDSFVESVKNSMSKGGFFTTIGEEVVQGFTGVGARIKQISDAIKKEFGGAAQAGEGGPKAFGQGLELDFENLKQKAAQAGQDIREAFDKALVGEGAGAGTLVEGFSAIFQQIVESAGQAAAQIQQVFQIDLSQSITLDWSGITNGAVEAAQQILQLFQDTAFQIGQIFTDAASTISQAFSGINLSSSLAATLDVLIQKMDQLTQAAREAAQAAREATQAAREAAAAGGDDGTGLPLATGGLFIGRRGGIDTNLAWLTSGEFVMNTSAVQKYGLNMMNAINSLRAPRFAGGGLNLNSGAVPRLIAPGSSPTSQRILTLNIEGRSFSGLQVPEGTAQALERFAVHSQIASSGRKQSWRR